MKTVAELCKPRENVFQDTTTDDVLDITNLINGTIDDEKFFSENFRTKGMSLLFDIAFQRFQGKTDTGVIKLTQSMGGGKTHNMLALALLAKNPALRKQILGKADNLGEIKVIAFTGRESDVKFGIWGALAEQMGRKELFKDLYAPLQAPGQSAWVNLFKGQKVLILLDELPPYLENARSIAVGASNLCSVTVTALSNLFNAMGQADMKNVLLVFSDLKATYTSGSGQLQSLFSNLENEANRMARDIAPVALNTDEVYDILKARLFESVPNKTDSDIRDVAEGYRVAAKDAVSAGFVNVNKDNTSYPDALYTGIVDSYPFHPSIKDLYARFKENPNFQQTRGLIRLMRQIVRQFYDSKDAEKNALITAYDVDLNNARQFAFIREIKPSLENAVSHDIAQGGKSVAELIDQETSGGRPYAQTVAKLLFMASLNDSLNGVNGLSERDAFGYLVVPGAELKEYRRVFEEIRSRSWYLKNDTAGRYYYQNTKNMVAEINSLVDSYNNEQAGKELRKVLQSNFAPKIKNCYETLYVMPAIDEIKADMNKVALVIYEPHSGTGLHPQLKEMWDNTPFKNRFLFLSGSRDRMETLYENAKKRTAVISVIDTMKASPNFSETDPQFKEATALLDKYTHALLSTIRETFISLYYPVKGDALEQSQFDLIFENNHFDGEKQVVQALTGARKFEDFTSDPRKLEVMRSKCEARLFTQKQMKWETIIERAATITSWPMLHPNQMNALKDYCFKAGLWRENGGYIEKGPFPLEPTAVNVDQTNFDEKTLEFTLKVHGINATTVYYEIGAEPSSASAKIQGDVLKTKETEIFFLAVDENPDEKKRHPTGPSLRYLGKVPLKYEVRRTGEGLVLQLKTHPKFVVRYTTDGSNPKENGGIYTGEIVLPKDCTVVCCAVYNHETLVEEKNIEIDQSKKGHGEGSNITIDPTKPLVYTFGTKMKINDTASVYGELQLLGGIEDLYVSNSSITIFDKGNNEHYSALDTSGIQCLPEQLTKMLDALRDNAFVGIDVTLNFSYKKLYFQKGSDFLHYVDLKHLDLNELLLNGKIDQ